MRKILFDLTKTQPLGSVKYHGGGKYGIAVCSYLIQNYTSKLSVYYNDKLYLDEECLQLLKKYEIESYKVSEGNIMDIAQYKDYVIYSPLFSKDYLKVQNVTVICTIHGLRMLEMPSDKYETQYARKRSLPNRILHKLGLNRLRLALQNKKQFSVIKGQYHRLLDSKHIHILTVSEHSKASLMCYFPSIQQSDIKVFYSPSTINANLPLCPSLYPSQKYWLMVSGDRWQKNCLRAILAFDSLFHERPDLEGVVIITGLNDFGTFRGVKIRHRERFICAGYVDELQLKSLYHNAYAFVYPSLNEGFGYPPLEAMHEGCPVVASAISAIPEVCGDAVLYFNPFMLDEIKMRILQLENPATRRHYIEMGIVREQDIVNLQQRDLHEMSQYLLSFTELK